MQAATFITDSAGCSGERRRRSSSPAWADGAALAPPTDLVRVFDAEPDLLTGLSAREVDLLRRRAIAPKLWVEEGPWAPPAPGSPESGSFGLLLVEGFMLRSVELDGRRCPELVGPGDVLRPWDEPEGSVASGASWTALDRASLAVLDQRITAIACRWPSIMAQLLARTVERSRSLALHLAIAHVRHADLRVRMLFWHLADRWGRMTPDGVHLPLRLRHELVAQLTCMRRPTASSALSQLARGGELAREPDGTWLLTGSPPTPLAS
jgi:CRP/FNR family transcriptional regulator, cyclic AMP receptor protein